MNTNIRYLKNSIITEYDMKSAALSIIKEFRLIPEKYISKLEDLEKDKRNILIGKLQQKFPELIKSLNNGYAEARIKFTEENNLQEDRILSIKKDAIFLINPSNIKEDITENIHFRPKNIYSSYTLLNINNPIEIYFTNSKDSLDIKNMQKNIKEFQKNYIIKKFYDIMKKYEVLSKEKIFDILKNFRNDYLTRKLPIGYYKSMENNKYSYDRFEIEEITEDMVDIIDITYNYNKIIRPFIENIMNYNE